MINVFILVFLTNVRNTYLWLFPRIDSQQESWIHRVHLNRYTNCFSIPSAIRDKILVQLITILFGRSCYGRQFPLELVHVLFVRKVAGASFLSRLRHMQGGNTPRRLDRKQRLNRFIILKSLYAYVLRTSSTGGSRNRTECVCVPLSFYLRLVVLSNSFE